jgi:hypothetical protein
MRRLSQKEIDLIVEGPPRRCSGIVFYSRGRSTLCGSNGAVIEDGKPWCRRHAPSMVRARRERRDRERNSKASIRAKEGQ